jgi:hypothetical protein
MKDSGVKVHSRGIVADSPVCTKGGTWIQEFRDLGSMHPVSRIKWGTLPYLSVNAFPALEEPAYPSL